MLFILIIQIKYLDINFSSFVEIESFPFKNALKNNLVTNNFDFY